MTDEPPLDPTDPSYISVHTSFNSPTSRIFIHLPHLPRIAPAPPTPFFPSPPPPFPPKPTRRIAVAISGDPNGIPVVVHGGMNGSRFLAWLLHDLGVANGCKIIVPDRPGMGLSDPWDLTTFPTPSTYPLLTSSTPTPWRGGFLDWSHHLLHILDHLHLPKVALMGMSCGCIYSLAFAQQYPHRVLDHVPIQLFACWVPPSLSECGWVVKSSMVVPTVAVVTTLTSVQRLVLDPGYAGVVNGFSKAAKWITDFVTSSGAFLLNSGGALLDPQKLKTTKKTLFAFSHGGGYQDEDPEDDTEPLTSTTEEPVKRDQGGLLLLQILMKLNAITYVMSRNPGMTGVEAEMATLKMVGALDQDGKRVERKVEGTLKPPGLDELKAMQTRQPNSTTPQMTTSSVEVNTTLPPPPSWSFVDVSAELPHLLPFPYSTPGSIDDFLHCIERTGPTGFLFEQVSHAVTARHGGKDTLVPVGSVKGVAERCGWRLEVFEEDGHDVRKSCIAEGFREIRGVVKGRMG